MDSSKALDVVAGVHERDLECGVVLGAGVDGDGVGLVVGVFGGHDAGDEGLGVAVVEREPGALDFDENGVAGLEDVVDVVKRVVVLVDGVRAERLRVGERCEVSAAKDFFVDHELVAAHGWVRVVVGILVDQFDDHVVVRAGGGGKDVRDDFAGDDQILLKHGEQPHGEILAIGDEALIFSEPVVPLRTLAVGGLDGAMAIGDGVSWSANINGFCGSLGCGPA